MATLSSPVTSWTVPQFLCPSVPVSKWVRRVGLQQTTKERLPHEKRAKCNKEFYVPFSMREKLLQKMGVLIFKTSHWLRRGNLDFTVDQMPDCRSLCECRTLASPLGVVLNWIRLKEKQGITLYSLIFYE